MLTYNLLRFLLIIFLMLSNCIALDTLGLSYDRIKGDEVASKLADAAITTDLVNSTILIGQPTISITAIFSSVIAGIDVKKYYKKSEVDDCINDIRGFKGFLLGSTITVATSCKLSPDGPLL
ncbi:TIGR04452 family lipoprotein [Leptospira venezuelensis]|uniref:TIGR04452 family lipoprotein n=1 Tax=Leptospira venezuelensis TaxID=1958811 RepID=UPI000A37EE95|nr:TIGR04452 family lipoprotein [Leptospira venezuelensis]